MTSSGCFLVVRWGWKVGNSVFPAILTLGAKLRGKEAKFANSKDTFPSPVFDGDQEYVKKIYVFYTNFGEKKVLSKIWGKFCLQADI